MLSPCAVTPCCAAAAVALRSTSFAMSGAWVEMAESSSSSADADEAAARSGVAGACPSEEAYAVRPKATAKARAVADKRASEECARVSRGGGGESDDPNSPLRWGRSMADTGLAE